MDVCIKRAIADDMEDLVPIIEGMNEKSEAVDEDIEGFDWWYVEQHHRVTK